MTVDCLVYFSFDTQERLSSLSYILGRIYNTIYNEFLLIERNIRIRGY